MNSEQSARGEALDAADRELRDVFVMRSSRFTGRAVDSDLSSCQPALGGGEEPLTKPGVTPATWQNLFKTSIGMGLVSVC